MGAETTAMTKIAWLLAAALSVAYGFAQEEKETIRKTYPAAARIEVDNVWGSVHVTGYNGAEIQMVAEKIIAADSQERLDAAKREVKLDVSQSGDALVFFVDGPFRCHCEDGRSSVHESGRRGYRVVYNFELKVPAATVLKLATVNGGEISVDNTTGDFDVNNVNGSIHMTEVAGSGRVHTVNGKISATFAKNPAGSCSFRTINGTIEASFRPNLSADLRLKTFNGHAYTDFPLTVLPNLAPTAERRNGRFIYRSNDFYGARVGNGGPEFKFDTLNGSIRIINRGQ